MVAEILTDSAWQDALVIGFALIIFYVWRRKRHLERAAKNITKSTDITFNTGYRWEETDLSHFPMLDPDFYEKTSEQMEDLGLRHLVDMNCLHLTEANPNQKVMMRTFLSESGDYGATAFHLRVTGWSRILMRLLGHKPDCKIVGFTSYLSDGRFIHTANNAGFPKLSHPEEVVFYRYQESTSPRELLAHHRETLNQLYQGDDEATVIIKVKTLEEMIEMETREHLIEQRYRQGLDSQYTENEVRDLSPSLSEQERQRFLELMKDKKSGRE